MVFGMPTAASAGDIVFTSAAEAVAPATVIGAAYDSPTDSVAVAAVVAAAAKVATLDGPPCGCVASLPVVERADEESVSDVVEGWTVEALTGCAAGSRLPWADVDGSFDDCDGVVVMSVVAATVVAVGANWLVLCDGTAVVAAVDAFLIVTRVAPAAWLSAAACCMASVGGAEAAAPEAPPALFAAAVWALAVWALAFVLAARRGPDIAWAGWDDAAFAALVAFVALVAFAAFVALVAFAAFVAFAALVASVRGLAAGCPEDPADGAADAGAWLSPPDAAAVAAASGCGATGAFA